MHAEQHGSSWDSACNEFIALYGSHTEHQQPSEVTVLESKLAEEPLVGSSLELLLHQLLSFLQQIIVSNFDTLWPIWKHGTSTALAIVTKQECHQGTCNTDCYAGKIQLTQCAELPDTNLCHTSEVENI